MLVIMGLVCLIAMYLAWRVYQPQTEVERLVADNTLLALKAEQINTQTSYLLFAQLKLVEDFRLNGDAAIEKNAYVRQNLQAAMETLSALVTDLNKQLLVSYNLGSENTVHLQARKQKEQAAAAKLSQKFELFQGLNMQLLGKLEGKNGLLQLSHAEIQVQAQRCAEELNLAAQELTQLTRSQSNQLIQKAQSEEAIFLKAIMLLSGFALLWNGILLYMLGKSLKNNAAMAKELMSLASLDPLTGLLNRRALKQHVAGLNETQKTVPKDKINQRVNQTKDSCLVLIDLDHFKQYNDTFGHAKGDVHLRACAAIWQKNVRSGDSVARVGGEEFVIIMPNCNAEQALGSLTRMQSAMPIGTSFSAGIALRLHEETFDHWYHRADVALYRAKAQGRAQSVIAQDREKMPTPSIKATFATMVSPITQIFSHSQIKP